MAEQGSDSANTGASGAELMRQLLDRTTLRARKEGGLAKPGLLAARRRDRAWAIVVGTSATPFECKTGPDVRPRAGRAAYRQLGVN